MNKFTLPDLDEMDAYNLTPPNPPEQTPEVKTPVFKVEYPTIVDAKLLSSLVQCFDSIQLHSTPERVAAFKGLAKQLLAQSQEGHKQITAVTKERDALRSAREADNELLGGVTLETYVRRYDLLLTKLNQAEEGNAQLRAELEEVRKALRDVRGLAIVWAAHYQAVHRLPDFHPTHAEVIRNANAAALERKGAQGK